MRHGSGLAALLAFEVAEIKRPLGEAALDTPQRPT